MVPISTIQPLATLLKHADKVEEILAPTQRKVEIAAQHVLGNPGSMFSNMAEALVVIAIRATGALAAVVGGYLYDGRNTGVPRAKPLA
jgi:hypothetical protein